MDLKFVSDALASFDKIAAFVRHYTAEEILAFISVATEMSAEQLAAYPMGGCWKNGRRGLYWYVISDLKKNIVHYEWVYQHLADDKSRGVFTNLVRFCVVPDGKFMEQASDSAYLQTTATFAKLNGIEGLLGAKQQIRKDNPELAICLEHIAPDIWEIPRLIHTINPNYRYDIRHDSQNQTGRTVLYAIPLHNKKPPKSLPQREKLGVYAPCPLVSRWNNQHLLKDCGLIPYMFYKVYGYDVTMVGVRQGEYPYLEKYLSGMKMDFLPDCRDDVELLNHHLRYLYQNYRTMDILILHGSYLLNHYLAPEYRKLRPDGKVYIGLDAISHWIDRIRWATPEFSGLLDSCDVIATSCTKMQKHLSKKWPGWKIEYIPNGFFNSTGREIVVAPAAKENIILTVGRIGTPQKANQVLLEAFARTHAAIPEWKIHLVGRIENNFNSYIDKYFQKYPQLKDRVLFKGLIESKEDLFDEYKRAKIFALTSTFEGGNPNVVSEALYHGCYIITSDVDGASDITNNGAVGRIFPRGDIGALAEILTEVCQNEAMLKAIVPEILFYAENTFDWELIIKRIHHLLFEG